MLCVGAFVSGWLAFASSAPVPATLTTVAHGLCGVGVVALVPWKREIVTRAKAVPLVAWALIVLTLLCLASGFGQFLLGYHVVDVLGALPLSPIQVHVGAALAAVPVFVWHVLRRRPQPLTRRDLSRRALLGTGAFTVGAGVGYLALLGVAGWTRGSAGRLPTGSGRIDADQIPATTWLLDRAPAVEPGHQIEVAGRSWSAADLAARGRAVTARLDCTSGWYAEATWSGTPISELADPQQLRRSSSIEVTSLTGYTRRFPVTEASDLWLVTSCQGRPLTPGTGAPVRLVAPLRRGFWWVKWVASVRLSDTPAWAQLPFPAQ